MAQLYLIPQKRVPRRELPPPPKPLKNLASVKYLRTDEKIPPGFHHLIIEVKPNDSERKEAYVNTVSLWKGSDEKNDLIFQLSTYSDTNDIDTLISEIMKFHVIPRGITSPVISLL